MPQECFTEVQKAGQSELERYVYQFTSVNNDVYVELAFCSHLFSTYRRFSIKWNSNSCCGDLSSVIFYQFE